MLFNLFHYFFQTIVYIHNVECFLFDIRNSMAYTSINSLRDCIIASNAGVHMISMNKGFHITPITFKEFWLYELEPYIVCIEQNSVKYIQKVIYFNWTHVVCLSQYAYKIYKEILYRFSSSSFTQICAFSKFNKWKCLIFLFFYPKMYILDIQQMKIFDFSQSRNDFYQTVPYWLPEYDSVYKLTRSFLSHLRQGMCDLF